jgi:hypothetical protein
LVAAAEAGAQAARGHHGEGPCAQRRHGWLSHHRCRCACLRGGGRRCGCLRGDGSDLRGRWRELAARWRKMLYTKKKHN